MKYSCITLGSCRVLGLFDKNLISNLKFNSIHSCNFYTSGGCDFIGKHHTPLQILYALKYIEGEVTINYDDLKRLFSMIEERVNWYKGFCPNYNFNQSIVNLKENIKYQKIFIFEICSSKETVNPDTLVPRQGELIDWNYDKNLNISDLEFFENNLYSLIEYVNNKYDYPLIILIGHIRNWLFNDEHKYIENRQIIYEKLKEYTSYYKNIILFDPAEILYKEDMLDDWHYKSEVFERLHNHIYNLIDNYFQRY